MPEIFLSGDVNILAVDNIMTGIHKTKCAQSHVISVAVVNERPRDFIGFAVAVRVAGLECLQHCIELIQRLRHFHPQLGDPLSIYPVAITQQHIAGRIVIGRRNVNVSIIRGQVTQRFREGFIDFLRIGRILCHQIFQRTQHTRHAVLAGIVNGKTEEENIAIVAGREQQAYLFIPARFLNRLNFQLDAGFFFQLAQIPHGVEIAMFHIAGIGNRQRHWFIHQWQLGCRKHQIGVQRGHIVRFRRFAQGKDRQANRQHDRKHQGKQSVRVFHGIVLLCLFAICRGIQRSSFDSAHHDALGKIFLQKRI